MAKRHITLPDSYEMLFLRLEEIIIANSGEDEFEEIFKLIVAKLWDEFHSNNIFKQLIYENDIKRGLEEILIEIYKSWNGVLYETKSNLNAEHLSVCVKLLADFDLFGDGFEAVDAFFEFIVSKIKKGSKGQYFTPRYLVDFCVRLIKPKENQTILDPACGSSAFLLHTYDYLNSFKSENVNVETENLLSKNLWGFDFDDKAIRISKVLMYVSGINNFNLYKLNSLLVPQAQQNLMFVDEDSQITTIEDILRITKNQDKFDVILTNPPFAGEIVEKDILNRYTLSKGKTRIERDVLFIERCLNLLKPGGKLAIILPDNKFGSSEFTYVRKFILHKARIVGVVGIPRNAFMPHTPVKTSILILQKRTKKYHGNSENIFFAISEKCGKDSRGNLEYVSHEGRSWKNVSHDLIEIELEFEKFLKNECIGW